MDKVDMVNLAYQKLSYAYLKHGEDKWSRHEFYAVLLEEIDELWNVIKVDGPTNELLAEMGDIVAVVMRYYETGNRYGKNL